jgi:ribosomal protein S12 methylthiotransferase
MGVFTYSYEPDTPAAKMEGHLEEEVKDSRREQLMAVQQQIMFEYNERQVGKTIDVIIDQPVAEQAGAWIGRSAGDAPDVDSVVFVTETEHPLRAGAIVPCEVVTFKDYDLVAVAVGEPR